MYPNLKLQIFKSGLHQNHLSKELGIADTVLSKIIRGYREPTEEQKRIIAQYLEVDQDWLFEKFDLSTTRVASNSSHLAEGKKDGNS